MDRIITVSNFISTWYFMEYQNLLYTATVTFSHKSTTQEESANAALAESICQEKVKSWVSFSLSLSLAVSQAYKSLAFRLQYSMVMKVQHVSSRATSNTFCSARCTILRGRKSYIVPQQLVNPEYW